MNNSINNGGKTHVKYDHFHYPRVIELHCPKCNAQALASNKDAPPGIEHFIEIAEFEKCWNIKCLTCDFRTTKKWEEMKIFKLWLKREIRDVEFWAWNRNHLHMILKRLKNENLESDRWSFFETYIPGIWLTQLRGKRELKKIEHLMIK